MKTVLLVEDTPLLAENMADIIRNIGCDVIVAQNGVEGLKKLEVLTPALIITDVLMPLMDGLEFIKSVRNISRFKTIPIVILSARATQEDIAAGKKAGADYYLTKPCSAEELIDMITKLADL